MTRNGHGYPPLHHHLGAEAEPAPATGVDAVVAERGAIYGHPYDDFGRVSELTKIIAGCPAPRFRHVLYMLCVKIARLVVSPRHRDSWVDVMGYGKTALMILDTEEANDADLRGV